MTKYLYGASVQGIQRFIFQTNELKDIVGASELVEFICTDLFKEMVGKGWAESNQIISAAGNVKYVFETEAECREVVRTFPRMVMTEAPGVTISQAVVELGDDFTQAVNELEGKLRSQRNRPGMSVTTGRLGLKRSPQTGLPFTSVDNNEHLDASTCAKRKRNNTPCLCQKSFGKAVKLQAGTSIPFEISKMTGKNDWIAIIHADGNGLGQVVQKIGHQIDDFKRFSHALDRATIAAANDAFRKVSPEGGWKGTIPVRPIVLGGDDMTAIIRGDLAIEYVAEFMRQFEKNTGEGELRRILEKAGMERLTACAGVAFTKSAYPFYYGYTLAEQLCTRAKKRAKENNAATAPSCLMFHKVQDSFIMNYDEIEKRELTTAEGNSFCYGPYFLNKGQEPAAHYSIDELESLSRMLDDEQTDGIKTGIRQWLTLMHENGGKAAQRLKRLLTMNESQRMLIEKLTDGRPLEKDGKVYPAYDVLALHTIINQQTKEERQ